MVGFHLDRVQVVDWGSGGSGVDMVGSHQGLIERSLFQGNNDLAGSGIQAKGGTSDIVIRANRFESAGGRALNLGGSTGLEFFRPQPPGTVEAQNLVAEGNKVIAANVNR